MMMKILIFYLAFFLCLSHQKLAAEESDVVNESENEQSANIYDDEFYKKIKDHSLFFSSEDIDKMMWIVNSINDGIRLTEEEILGEEALDKLKQKTKSSVEFHLNSIAFFNDGNWAVWLNGKQIKENNEKDDISIVEVLEEKVSFRWNTGYSKFVNAVRNYIESEQKDSRIIAVIKDGIATVDFVIEPNQMLTITDNIQIQEGGI